MHLGGCPTTLTANGQNVLKKEQMIKDARVFNLTQRGWVIEGCNELEGIVTLTRMGQRNSVHFSTLSHSGLMRSDSIPENKLPITMETKKDAKTNQKTMEKIGLNASETLFFLYLLQKYSLLEDALSVGIKNAMDTTKACLLDEALKRHYKSTFRENHKKAIEKYQKRRKSIASYCSETWFLNFASYIESFFRYGPNIRNLIVLPDAGMLQNTAKTNSSCHQTSTSVRHIRSFQYEVAGSDVLILECSKGFRSDRLTVFISEVNQSCPSCLNLTGPMSLANKDARIVVEGQMRGKAWRSEKGLWYHVLSNRFRRVTMAKWHQSQDTPNTLLKRFATLRYLSHERMNDFTKGDFPYDAFMISPLIGAKDSLCLLAATEIVLSKPLLMNETISVKIGNLDYDVCLDDYSVFPHKLGEGKQVVVFGVPITKPSSIYVMATLGDSKISCAPANTRVYLPFIKDVLSYNAVNQQSPVAKMMLTTWLEVREQLNLFKKTEED